MILPDFDTCYRALRGRDTRFDGWFFTAVRTTGIYCRPSCPALTPQRHNVEFHPSAASAQRAGFRACKRCRPDATPGSPEWDVRGDLAGRALRLIGEGIVDREGVPGLSRRLGYSERQVNRVLMEQVGAGPIALARAQRAQTARVLLETTDLPIVDVAFAAGFASVRQFNDTVQAVFATTPSGLRSNRRATPAEPGTITLRLPYREPLDFDATLRFLAARVIPGIEQVDEGGYHRVLQAAGGPARVSVTAGTGGALSCRVTLTDHRDLVSVVARVRRLLDLDADPVAVDETLSATSLRRAVRARPGLRAPGAVDGFEMALRAVVGQQVSVRSARSLLGKLTETHGVPAFDTFRLFPSPVVIAALDPQTLPMPASRARTVIAVARALADGGLILDPGSDREREYALLLAMPGIGPWTADYIRMRAMADPDVLLATDLGVRRSAATVGLDLKANSPAWAPWRSYVTHHLWALGALT